GTVVSPGEIVSILGTGIGPEEPAARHLDPLNPLKEAETTLSDTRVLFDGVAAPLTFVQATKVNAVVPPTVVGKETTQVEIEYQGQRSSPLALRVASSTPGLFTFNSTGRDQGTILNQDFSLNSSENPADRGSVVVLYATGVGQTGPAEHGGTIDGVPPLEPLMPVICKIGGIDAEVLSSRANPGGMLGVVQLTVRVPVEIQSGSAVTVVIKIGDAYS